MVQVWPSSEKKSILSSLICALLLSCVNTAKPVNIYFYLIIFYKHYSSSKYDVFEMVPVPFQIGRILKEKPMVWLVVNIAKQMCLELFPIVR